MELANNLFLQLIPLYLSVILGYIAGKWLDVEGKGIAALCFYIFAPISIFSGLLNLEFSRELLLLPVVIFFVSSALSLVTYSVGKRLWQDSRGNVAAYSSGRGNYGTFGLPIALMLFDDTTTGIYILAGLGIAMWRSTLGFYLVAQSTYSARDALVKTLQLPILYAIFAGIAANLLQLPIPEYIEPFFSDTRIAFGILGMLLIGISIANIRTIRIDKLFIGMLMFNKYIAWPLIVIGLILIDSHWLHWFEENVYDALILLSIVPMAINTVVVAQLLGTQPERTATALLVSTIISLIYIPVMCGLFLMH